KLYLGKCQCITHKPVSMECYRLVLLSTSANPKGASEGNDIGKKVTASSAPMRRILVVDDERDIADVVKMALSSRYKVIVYGNPSQALGSYKTGFYDLILLDYRMPFMDGFEFYSQIKRIDPKVKICLMTAYETFASKVDD